MLLPLGVAILLLSILAIATTTTDVMCGGRSEQWDAPGLWRFPSTNYQLFPSNYDSAAHLCFGVTDDTNGYLLPAFACKCVLKGLGDGYKVSCPPYKDTPAAALGVRLWRFCSSSCQCVGHPAQQGRAIMDSRQLERIRRLVQEDNERRDGARWRSRRSWSDTLAEWTQWEYEANFQRIPQLRQHLRPDPFGD